MCPEITSAESKISSPSASLLLGWMPVSYFRLSKAHEDSAERGRCGASLKQSFLAAAQRPQRSVSIYTFFKDIIMLVCVFGPFAGSLLI
jgi:hypothetical protein